MKKKKILIFLQDSVGGAERVSVLLGKFMSKERYDVKFCLVDRNSKTSIADFIPEGYPIIRIPAARKKVAASMKHNLFTTTGSTL